MRVSRSAILVALVGMMYATSVDAQIVPQTISLTGEIGPAFYIGEFNSLDRSGTFNPSVGIDVGAGLKYQIASNFALMASIGFARLSYVVDDYVRSKYGSNFFGPLSNTTYPGTTVPMTKLNYIDYTRYVLFAQSHFNITSRLVPYFTLGVGLIDYSVTNSLADELPKNMTGEYSSQSLVMPIGGGVQYSIGERVALHGHALFYVNTSDYLDGYAHYVDFEANPGVPGAGDVPTPPDYPVAFSFGVSYAIYVPEERYEPPIATAEPRPTPEEPAEQPAQEPQVEASEPEPEPEPEPLAQSGPDSDLDGLSDSSEVHRFLTNPSNPDSDGDGLRDAEEVFRHNTSPNNADTDRDALGDGNEVLVHNTEPLDADSDDDLLTDGDEVNGTRTGAMYASTGALGAEVMAVRQATDPLDPDTDGDGVPDGIDACPTVAGDARQFGCPSMAAAAESPASYRADFEGITFRPNTADFDFSRPTTKRDLDRLLELVNECDDIGVLIEGHTSGEGSRSWNQTLSAQRARRVYNFLLANGVPARKLFGAVGYGSRLPQVAETGTGARLEELRSQNRRITALVRKPCG